MIAKVLMPAPQEHQVVYTTLQFEQPWTFENYLKVDGYKAWKKILAEKPDPATIIDELKKSALRGRGGAGFPTGLKWSFMPKVMTQKYILCNSDESEPGTCKDRDILRFNPHAVIEGLAIACYATGSSVAYNYLRGEFHHEPFEHIELALKDAYAADLLGRNIGGSGIDVDIFNALGAGATGLVVLIIAVSKFDTGAVISPSLHLGQLYPRYGVWIVLALVPLMVLTFLKIRRHYEDIREELSLDRLDSVAAVPAHNTVLVLVSRLHRGIIEALNYARLTSDDVRAVYIETDSSKTAAMKEEWQKHVPDTPLVIMESPYRSLVGPLMRYIDAVQKERSDDVVTIVIPELVSRKLWHHLLHNQAGTLLKLALLNRRDVFVTNARYFLEH